MTTQAREFIVRAQKETYHSSIESVHNKWKAIKHFKELYTLYKYSMKFIWRGSISTFVEMVMSLDNYTWDAPISGLHANVTRNHRRTGVRKDKNYHQFIQRGRNFGNPEVDSHNPTILL